jgi:hypothetical protein
MSERSQLPETPVLRLEAHRDGAHVLSMSTALRMPPCMIVAGFHDWEPERLRVTHRFASLVQGSAQYAPCPVTVTFPP